MGETMEMEEEEEEEEEEEGDVYEQSKNGKLLQNAWLKIHTHPTTNVHTAILTNRPTHYNMCTDRYLKYAYVHIYVYMHTCTHVRVPE